MENDIPPPPGGQSTLGKVHARLCVLTAKKRTSFPDTGPKTGFPSFSELHVLGTGQGTCALPGEHFSFLGLFRAEKT